MSEKSLKKVFLSSDVYAMCFNHALVNDKEEVMGLLIGEVDDELCTAFIFAYLILHRSDKQPDRVEISPEQLSTASDYAEQLSVKLNRKSRVLGWYHSHPHITVWPSHVDVRTQAMYQLMDPFFVGLIFAVYQNENNGHLMQMICFQAITTGSEYRRKEVELVISKTFFQPYNLECGTSLPKIIGEEVTSQDEGNCENDVLIKLHNEAFKTMSMTHVISQVTEPLHVGLQHRLESVRARIKMLKILKGILTSV